MATDNKKPKIVVILGATSSGKSDLAVEIAQSLSGEVVGADSRQVYRGLDIATGKITEEDMQGVPHHLISIASPNDAYTVAKYKQDAEKAIRDILYRDKLPVLCGGTGFYIQSIVDNLTYPKVPPDNDLRDELSIQTTRDLFNRLQTLDQNRAQDIDPRNRVRLIRAIEITKVLGSVPEIKPKPKYQTLQIGLDVPKNILKERIEKRTKSRMERGMIDEAEHLYKNGLSLGRMYELGLEYRILAAFLESKMTKADVEKQINLANIRYAKKQLTWFSRDKRIRWIPYDDTCKVKKLISEFLKTEEKDHES